MTRSDCRDTKRPQISVAEWRDNFGVGAEIPGYMTQNWLADIITISGHKCDSFPDYMQEENLTTRDPIRSVHETRQKPSYC
jgi:hypothetical protein